MDAYGVRRRDTTKGPPLRILSLDGGGVRGYSMLIILQELMYRTYIESEGRPPRRDQIPKPCDHFDLIIGTGTGGLIALMLGRLRLDLERCKELYVRLTQVVFETDKTFAGIPYRSTLFKASKLEDVIKECIQEHTVFTREGNDGSEIEFTPTQSSVGIFGSSGTPRRHSSNASVLSFSARSPQSQMARPAFHNRYGNPEARLYDARENRTKTAVTAIFKGTPKGGDAILLRSYDSRREPPPEFDCKIWQAGRATCAIGLAFKPIQIGQSVFHDDGAGTFNPSPMVLDEAVVNEWPGREVGVFLSIGTGRRPKTSETNQSLWYEGFMGEFAEARRRLVSKIEGCEQIHEYMLREHLAKRNVNVENYYRFNVEIGVGEFGMNEWNRLSEISTGTRRYMMKEQEQKMVDGVTVKLAKIHRAKLRFEGAAAAAAATAAGAAHGQLETKDPRITLPPLAVELLADLPADWPRNKTPPSRPSYESGSHDNIRLHENRSPSPPTTGSPGSYAARPLSPPSPVPSRYRPAIPNAGFVRPPSSSTNNMDDTLLGTAPTPAQYRQASGTDKISVMEPDEMSRRRNNAGGAYMQQSQPLGPPPIPPKTPLANHYSHNGAYRAPASSTLPYPDDDDEEDDHPPPAVNMARKPEYTRR